MRLDFDDLDAALIAAFLEHLEHERHNTVRTRNARLAAIHSLFRFAALRHPEHAALIQRVLAIPPKRFERALITFLSEPEIDALHWLDERKGGPADPLFPTNRGTRLSRDALERRLAKYQPIAARACPSLTTKNITPHVLRHTAAMRLLHAGVDTSVIALWLGHESVETTQTYLQADLALKERALARITPASSTPGRYRPPDTTLAFLQSL